jgi:peptidoglycan/xylan/chitin deacetylase (PgdA/CDA1 family)
MEKDPAVIAKHVLADAKPGDVVLFHDGLKQTVAALPGILDSLRTTGYELLTLSQILSFPDDKPH